MTRLAVSKCNGSVTNVIFPLLVMWLAGVGLLLVAIVMGRCYTEWMEVAFVDIFVNVDIHCSQYRMPRVLSVE